MHFVVYFISYQQHRKKRGNNLITKELPMGEHSSSRYFLEERQKAAAEDIGTEALVHVDRTYGRGYPFDAHGLAYHNGYHGREVGRGAMKLCALMDLPEVDQAIAGAAGKTHDLIVGKGRGTDEAESAAWLAERMEAQKVFPAQHRLMGALAILGTEPLFNDSDLIIGQQASHQDYPSKSAELVAKSVASADMGKLYTPEGPHLSHLLYREIKDMPPTDELDIPGMINYQRGNVELTETYRYPLEIAESALATHRPEVIHFHQNVLEEMQRGDIETWEQLLERGRQFIVEHRA
jgi:hypothetical protein